MRTPLQHTFEQNSPLPQAAAATKDRGFPKVASEKITGEKITGEKNAGKTITKEKNNIPAPLGQPILVTESLGKTYGDRVALQNLNLTVRAGEVFGYIGPNGAGKTTTFRILAGLLQPSVGIAKINGQDVTRSRDQIKQLVGYLPDNFGVYPQLSVYEFLDFFAAAYAIAPKLRKDRIDFCLEIANASEFRDKRMGSLSRGMKQRVGIAKTLLHDPALLILDEPAATIDPRARVHMRQLLRTLADSGKAVLVSSHILPELADVCDTVGILAGGKMVVCGPVRDVLRKARPQRLIEITLAGPASIAVKILRDSPGRWKPAPCGEPAADPATTVLRYETLADNKQLSTALRAMVLAGLEIVNFTEIQANLEDAFMQLTD
jgi:ABC-2 type transport system ATP-binding protein